MKKEQKNIKSLETEGLCTGCGTCVAICPTGAIEITIDEKRGIYLPRLNEEKCNNCGICYEVCSGREVDFRRLNLEVFGKEPEDTLIGNYLKCYIGHAANHDVRYNSSSGGLATALLLFALEEGIIDGALVTRMKKDKPLEPEPFISRTKEDIIEACGSKYCPVPVNVVLKEILDSKETEKFAVVGLPCHIHGIRRLEQKNKKLKKQIRLHLGLCCAGSNFNFKGIQFFLRKMNIAEESIKKIVYRTGEFPPGKMMIELKNGTQKWFDHVDFRNTLFSLYTSFAPMRCLSCIDPTNILADVSVGSYWSQYLRRDVFGESACIVRNNPGLELIKAAELKNRIILTETSKEKAIEYQKQWMYLKRYGVKQRTSSFAIFRKQIPAYDIKTIQISKHKLRDLLSSLILYLRIKISLQPSFWPLLRLFMFIYKIGFPYYIRVKNFVFKKQSKK
jgi:coenzyme F420 hydrogenase subunit beta